MRNLIPVKSIGVFILLLNTCFSGQAQLEIDGGSPGIKVTSGNIAGQFNGVELGVKATNSIVGKAVEGIDESTSASSAGVKGFST
ncbi:MAG: hypothetical protein HKN76_09140, partial [Saprospiraceae bacterium]|nr:hypothetical protein [Saprospiraceae bacterium]